MCPISCVPSQTLGLGSVCVCPISLCPIYKIEGGDKKLGFFLCVWCPISFFLGVPSNGINRVGWIVFYHTKKSTLSGSQIFTTNCEEKLYFLIKFDFCVSIHFLRDFLHKIEVFSL